jgi:hypothetical protein
MAVDPATQREYGLAENQHVLATMFNPKLPLHDNHKYLEESAENACDQARRAFGADDPIYLDARISISRIGDGIMPERERIWTKPTPWQRGCETPIPP